MVSIMGLAAVGGAVVTNPHDCENPNDILGVYTVAEYTQGGIGPDGEWHWYETGDGKYDGETIIIERYDDGFIKGYAYLNYEKFELNGLYDPETFSFGYASYYNDPNGDDDVVDIIYGFAGNGLMILTGYTVSAKNATQAFAFNFIFTKGGMGHINPFHELDAQRFNVNAKQLDIQGNEKNLDPCSYVKEEYRNGIYKLTIDDEYAAAFTVMPNVFTPDDAMLRCIHLHDGSICTEWIMVEGNTMYAFANDSWDTTKTTLLRTGDVTGSIVLPVGALNTSVKMQSSFDWMIHETQYRVNFIQVGYDTYSVIVENETFGNKFILNEWFDAIDGAKLLSFMYHANLGGTEYYGDLVGFAFEDRFLFAGFIVSENGETFAVRETFNTRQ